MTARRQLKIPRVLLVYCEGKTEEAYFNILFDFYRPPAFVEVEVYGQKGQHVALINNTIVKRNELCNEMGYTEHEIECWAVCDEDKMPYTYTELLKYADDHDVHLAFSAPQFEMYLLQHFEQSGDTDKNVVFQKLSAHRRKHGSEGDYDDDTKADLAWMNDAIDQKPKIVKTAIINSEIRNHTTKRPFLTVQELVKRIMELSL
ncbi:RloB family protein [Adlercreutzia sp. ZJ141]|uniref:RloB family protein n=1 Tax=Adlercreutzia sp. ZJ141 TaxID=2709406 RepID=UPI0013EB246F|nr:RloB family protein [Adlercreutzia sp. ZJ141]